MGFDVEFFADFLKQCPMNYTLTINPYEQHTEYLEKNGPRFDFQFMRGLHVPRDFTKYHTSQAIVISPSIVAYYKGTTHGISQSIWLFHGSIYIIASILGSIILAIIVKLERQMHTALSIKEVMWNFILSPFGLCGDSIMTSAPLKVFTLTWLMVWFLIAGNFWAEMSSSMTVSKLREDITTFEDVWRSKREFFWTGHVKNMTQKIVKQLREKYEGFAGPAHRAYEKSDIGSTLIPWKNMTSDLLRKNQVLLAWSLDLYLQLNEELRNDPNLIIKKDWSVPITFHYSLSKRSTAILDALNEFIADRRASGKMEHEENRWWGLNRTFHQKPDEIDLRSPLDNIGTLGVAFYVAMVGVTLSLIMSCISVLTRRVPIHGDDGGLQH